MRIRKLFIGLTAVLALMVSPLVVPSAAFAADGNIRSPFPDGTATYIYQGYSSGTHTGTSQYGLDLTRGSSSTSTAGQAVVAPLVGTVAYWQAAYGNLCVNVPGGRSYTLTHINASVTSGGISAGQQVGTVAAAGNVNNNNVSHLHFEFWSSSNCYNANVIPFDAAHGLRICGAPDLPASGPSNNGIWGRISFTSSSCGTPPPPAPTAIAGGKMIQNPVSGRCVDIAGYGTVNGTQVQLYDCHDNAAQRWLYVDGQLKAYGNYSRCLDGDGTGGSPANGRKVQLWECNGSANQQWIRNHDGTIRWKPDGRCLDAEWGGTSNGTALQLVTCNGNPAQQWTGDGIQPASIANGKMVTNPVSGRCMDVAGLGRERGTTVWLWDCYDNSAQRWLFTEGQFKVYNYSTRCLDADGSGAGIDASGNGRRVQIWECNGGLNQKWVRHADGTIRWAGDGRCLTSSGSSRSNGTALTLVRCSGSRSQEWLGKGIATPKVFASTPAIKGKAKVGRTLRVKVGKWGPSGVALKYRWYRSGKAIKGATKSVYKVRKSDRGKSLKVRVTGSLTGYKAVVKTSKALKIRRR